MIVYLFILAIFIVLLLRHPFLTIIGAVVLFVVGNLYARGSENREHKKMVREYEKRRAELTAGMTEEERDSWDRQESLRDWDEP